MSAAATIDVLCALGVVPVVRTRAADDARRAAQWLAGAGIGAIEITMTVPDAPALVRALAAEGGDRVVGAGTVLDGDAARACIDAGARFVVCPGIAEDVARACADAGVACLLGAGTPSEVMRARALGADAVKIFPASSFGGAAHVKALKAVFPDVALVPTGGIAVEDIAAHLRAGAAFVGVGGRLADPAALAAGDAAAVAAAAREALAQVRAARA